MIDVVVGDNESPQNDTMKDKLESPSKPEENARSTTPIKPDIKALALFIAALFAYMILAMLSIDSRYVDYGDGNYLYLSWRMTQGEALFKEIPSPQPPLLLFVGKFLLDLSDGDPGLVRLWQIIQHALTACCVWGIASRLFSIPLVSALAGSFYLFMPEGVWWAAGFQSEPLLILLLSFNLLLFMTAVQQQKSRWAIYASGLVSTLCCYTNMTALPYIALQWFFVAYRFRRRFLLRYTLSFLIPSGLFFIAMWIYSNGQYIDHVFFRQIGTYPADSLIGALRYFAGKLYVEGGDILFFEGGFVLGSLAGMLLFFSEDRKNPLQEYLLWWAIFSLGSIIFVTKGGTVEYIFTLGEPAVAVFSAYFFLTLFAATDLKLGLRSLTHPLHLGKCVLVVCLFLPVLCMKPFSLLYRTFTNGPLVFFPGQIEENGVYELTSAEMDMASTFIQRYCPPNKTLVSPPYYAFLSKRKLAENSTCLFILGLTYYNEWDRFVKTENTGIHLPSREDAGRNMYKEMKEKTASGVRYQMDYNNEGTYYNTQAIFDLADLFDKKPELRTKYPVIHQFLTVRKQIMNKEVGLIVKDMRHFFFYVPPLHQAVRDYCAPLDQQLQLDNREERIVFYAPKS